MYDPVATQRAALAHARAVHAGSTSFAAAAAHLRALSAQAELWADPIAGPLIELAEAFEAGDLATVIIPAEFRVVAVDDAAVPEYRQGSAPMIVYREADARARHAADAAALRARYPGFPRSR